MSSRGGDRFRGDGGFDPRGFDPQCSFDPRDGMDPRDGLDPRTASTRAAAATLGDRAVSSGAPTNVVSDDATNTVYVNGPADKVVRPRRS